MITINGKYTSAKVMTDDVEDHALAQLNQLCDLEWMKNGTIVSMPDIHVGKVATIGFTCTQPYSSPVMPILVGNDIGCSVTTVKLEMRRKPEWKKLDTVIRDNIPVGLKKRSQNHRFYDEWYEEYGKKIHAKCKIEGSSLGTLGGGNHFIEVDIDDEGNYYLTIHSGSRSIGAHVYEYWQEQADLETNGNGVGRTVPRELTYLSNADSIYKYIDDVKSCVRFAEYSHLAIIDDICKGMKWDYQIKNGDTSIHSIHNTISDNYELIGEYTYTIRKGAIQALKGDHVIIPINMKDGIIIGVSKGNPEYNMSAPHGGGRVLARKEVVNNHTLNEFKTIMNGIYSPTINKDTLDEAPFAYRSLEQILPLIEDIIDIKKILKPVYNYKGGSK